MHYTQRAVWRNGGSSPQKVQWKLVTDCPAGSSMEAATTPSRHHVMCKRATASSRGHRLETRVQPDSEVEN